MVVGGGAVARSLVHGGQNALHDRDKTLTVLVAIKKGGDETLKGSFYLRVNLNQSYLKHPGGGPRTLNTTPFLFASCSAGAGRTRGGAGPFHVDDV